MAKTILLRAVVRKIKWLVVLVPSLADWCKDKIYRLAVEEVFHLPALHL